MKVYIADVTPLRDMNCFNEAYQRVPEERQAKIDSFRFQKDKMLSLAVWLLLQRALGEMGIKAPKIAYTPEGKPYLGNCDAGSLGRCDVESLGSCGAENLRNCVAGSLGSCAAGNSSAKNCNVKSSSAKNLWDCDAKSNSAKNTSAKNQQCVHFSLSHSGAMAMCAIGKHPLGCDVEEVTTPPLEVCAHVFSKDEQRLLSTFGEEELKCQFFKLWTAKESYLKMTGEGLKGSPAEFSITLPCSTQMIYGRKVTFFDIPCDNKYQATVCAEGACPEEVEVYNVDLSRPLLSD